MGNTEADGANGILRNTALAVPLKYLNNLWRTLEMLLINCKVELKLRGTDHWVLSANGNGVASPKNIIFTIKDRELYVPAVILSAKYSQNY